MDRNRPHPPHHCHPHLHHHRCLQHDIFQSPTSLAVTVVLCASLQAPPKSPCSAQGPAELGLMKFAGATASRSADSTAALPGSEQWSPLARGCISTPGSHRPCQCEQLLLARAAYHRLASHRPCQCLAGGPESAQRACPPTTHTASVVPDLWRNPNRAMSWCTLHSRSCSRLSRQLGGCTWPRRRRPSVHNFSVSPIRPRDGPSSKRRSRA